MSDGFGFVVFLVVVDVVMVGSVLGTVWAAATGRMTANPTMGLRTPATVASHAAWEAGHRAALPRAIAITVICLVLIVAALVLAWIGQTLPAFALALSPVIVTVAGLVQLVRAANDAALAVHPRR